MWDANNNKVIRNRKHKRNRTKNGTSNNVKKDKNRYCLLRYGQMSKTAKSMATILIENMAGKH